MIDKKKKRAISRREFIGKTAATAAFTIVPRYVLGDNGGGVLFVGTKGKLSCGTYGGNPVLLPKARMKDFDPPPKTIPRSPGIREEWIAACKTDSPTTSNFDYAAKLTETMLLGCIALRVADKYTTLQWNGPKLRFTNLDMANRYVDKKYRKGWSL